LLGDLGIVGRETNNNNPAITKETNNNNPTITKETNNNKARK
jgi:hypothetical protein